MCGHIEYALKDRLDDEIFLYTIKIQEEGLDEDPFVGYSSDTPEVRESIVNQVMVGKRSYLDCESINLGEESSYFQSEGKRKFRGKYWTRDVECKSPKKIVERSYSGCV